MEISTGKKLKSRREKIEKSDFTPLPEKFPFYAPGYTTAFMIGVQWIIDLCLQ